MALAVSSLFLSTARLRSYRCVLAIPWDMWLSCLCMEVLDTALCVTAEAVNTLPSTGQAARAFSILSRVDRIVGLGRHLSLRCLLSCPPRHLPSFQMMPASVLPGILCPLPCSYPGSCSNSRQRYLLTLCLGLSYRVSERPMSCPPVKHRVESL